MVSKTKKRRRVGLGVVVRLGYDMEYTVEHFRSMGVRFDLWYFDCGRDIAGHAVLELYNPQHSDELSLLIAARYSLKIDSLSFLFDRGGDYLGTVHEYDGTYTITPRTGRITVRIADIISTQTKSKSKSKRGSR